MYKVFLIVAALFFTNMAATAQVSDDELARLRARLNLPVSTSVIEFCSTKLSTATQLKIYIATHRDGKAYDYFTKWVDKWNEGAGKKHGMLQIVSGISQADVVLARYTVPEERTVVTRNTIGIGPVRNPETMRTSTKPTFDRRFHVPVPLYLYLLVPTSPGALDVVYRSVDRSYLADRADPDTRLLNELKKRIKDR